MQSGQWLTTSLVLVFALTFAPIISSYAVIVAAFDGDPTAVNEENTVADIDTSIDGEDQPCDDPSDSDIATSEEQDPDEKTVTEDSADPDAYQKAEDPIESVSEKDTEEKNVDELDEDPLQVEETEPEATKTEYVYKGNGVRVTAVLDDPDAIPDDAKLIAKPIRKGTGEYDYDAYMDALNRGSDSSYDENNTLLYDIAFIRDGVELQPTTGKVSVTFEFLDSQLSDSLGAKKASDVNVIHLPLTDTLKEQYDTTSDADNISCDDIIVEEFTKSENNLAVSVKNEKVKFETSDFSVFAYTVDFEYTDPETGKVYTYNLEGAGSITIKELAIILGITTKAKADDFIKSIESVKFSNE